MQLTPRLYWSIPRLCNRLEKDPALQHTYPGVHAVTCTYDKLHISKCLPPIALWVKLLFEKLDGRVDDEDLPGAALLGAGAGGGGYGSGRFSVDLAGSGRIDDARGRGEPRNVERVIRDIHGPKGCALSDELVRAAEGACRAMRDLKRMCAHLRIKLKYECKEFADEIPDFDIDNCPFARLVPSLLGQGLCLASAIYTLVQNAHNDFVGALRTHAEFTEPLPITKVDEFDVAILEFSRLGDWIQMCDVARVTSGAAEDAFDFQRLERLIQSEVYDGKGPIEYTFPTLRSKTNVEWSVGVCAADVFDCVRWFLVVCMCMLECAFAFAFACVRACVRACVCWCCW
jgi:hypothetical protein